MDHFEKISARLEELGLDGMLVTGEANRFYASGFHSAGTDGVALVTRKGAYYMTDSRYTEAAGRCVRAELLETCAGRGYGVLTEEIVQKEGIRRLGFEDAYMTVREREAYGKALSCELVPATDLLWQLRTVKDPEELEAMIAAQRIAEQAFAQILGEIRPGVTEKEIAARLQYLMLHLGAENMSFDPVVVSGPNGSLPHGVPSERAVQAGEFVTMDFGCIYHGYCSDMTRTVAVGKPAPEMERVYQVVLEAQQAGIAAARAGLAGREIDAAGRTVIQAAGYGEAFSHSFGHSLGLEIHESPNAAPGEERIMPVGAVVSAEPGIYLPGRFGVRIEDVIVLSETGCRDLTKSPKELIVL